MKNICDCIDGFGPSVSIIEHPNHCYELMQRQLSTSGTLSRYSTCFSHTVLSYYPCLSSYADLCLYIMCFIIYSQIIVKILSHLWVRTLNAFSTFMFTKTLPPFCANSYLRLYIPSSYPRLHHSLLSLVLNSVNLDMQ